MNLTSSMYLNAFAAYDLQRALAASHMAMQRAQYDTGIVNMRLGEALANYSPAPCAYCGRTSNKHGHKSCDGCGAPRGAWGKK